MFSKSAVFLAICLLVIAASCSHTKEFPEKYGRNQLHFGQGGGFTGMVTYFVLLEDGRLFQRQLRDSTYTYIYADKWNQDFVTQMFSNYKLSHFEQLTYYEPGDLYYFIEYHSGKETIHKVAWGRPGFRPDNNLVTYYNLLFKSTKSKS
jgi:hypothetical protein